MRPSSKSAAAAATPASLTSPKSSATKRQRKAAPLGDVTNLFVPAETPTPTPSPSKPRRTAARRSLPAPSDVSAVSSACSSSASVTAAPKPSADASAPKPSAAAFVTPARKPPSRKPSPAAFVTPAPNPSSAAVIQEDRTGIKSPAIATVYRRTTEAQGRWRRNPAAANSKGKEPVPATGSCRPPHGKSGRTQSRSNALIGNKSSRVRPISASASCYEAKKKRSFASTPNLLEGLLEKQRAYFADIDAFELLEEVVSESELD